MAIRWIIFGLFLLTFFAAIEGPLQGNVAYHNQAELAKIQHDQWIDLAISTNLSLGICLACVFLMPKAGYLAGSLFAVGLLNFLILAVDVPRIFAN